MKPKALLFYSYLPPWRIDIFNEMGKYYDLTIVFLFKNPKGFEYDQSELTNRLKVNYIFLEGGVSIGSRQFHTGIGALLKKYKPKIVFSHEYSPTSVLISLLLKLKIFSFQYVITTSDNTFMVNHSSIFRKIARSFILSKVNGIIVYSDAVKNLYEMKYQHLKIEVCPNIQNPLSLLSNEIQLEKEIENHVENFNLKGFKIVLYIGRFNKVKGLQLLLDAFSKTGKKNWKLVLVGDGELNSSLQEQAKKLGISDQLVLPGKFYRTELYAWYKLANFFVLPSTYEPFGAVVNESLVFGTPVILSKYCGSLDYIKEGQNGHIFDPLNAGVYPMILKNAMEKYADKQLHSKNLMHVDFKDYPKVFTNFT